MKHVPSDVSLTRADRKWLGSLDRKYARSPEPLPVRHEALLRELRVRLKADFLMWAVLQGDSKERAATLEFLALADDDTADQVDRARQWLRLASRLNVTPDNNDIFRHFATRHPHVTITRVVAH